MFSRTPLTGLLLTTAVVVFCFAGTDAFAKKANKENADSEGGTQLSTFLPNVDLDFSVPKATGEIRVDGDLSDPMWKNAVKLENFAEVNPGENVPAAGEYGSILLLR